MSRSGVWGCAITRTFLESWSCGVLDCVAVKQTTRKEYYFRDYNIDGVVFH
jgi:hypothetical protein